jgi:hypothetical protein
MPKTIDEPLIDTRHPAVEPSRSAHRHRDTAPKLVWRLYRQMNLRIRTEMLDCLIRPLNPLGLVAIARGAFAPLLDHRPKPDSPEDLEFASSLTCGQITALAEFVEQVDPQAMADVGAVVAEHARELAPYSAATARMLLESTQASGHTSHATSTTRSNLRH